MKTSRNCVKALAGCVDAADLRTALEALCARDYGKVTSINVMTVADAEKRRALCFLRLESETRELQLIAGVGGVRFGNDVLIIVDLPPRSIAQASRQPAQAAQLAHR